MSKFQKGDKVIVLDTCDDTRGTGWPVGWVGSIVKISVPQALVNFPGATEGHNGNFRTDLENTSHWWIDLEYLAIPTPPKPDPLVTSLIEDYHADTGTNRSA